MMTSPDVSEIRFQPKDIPLKNDVRNPYSDPMSFLQVDLLRRWRAKGGRDAELAHAIFTTIKGIARGLQNTG